MKIQLEYLLLLQNFRGGTNHIFDWFFSHVTMLGEFLLPVMLTAIIYWMVSKKCAIFMMWNLSLGLLVNQFFKSLACIYRPWILDERIKPVKTAIRMASGYSFPSGHTAIAASVFGGIGVYLWKNKWIFYSMIAIVLFVAFSRNYLGVHTPQDVLFSLIAGALLLYGIPYIQKWVEEKKNRDIIIYFAVILLIILLILYSEFKSYPLDYVDGRLLVDPVRMKLDTYPKAGFAFGFFTGWLIDRRFIKYEVNKSSVLLNFVLSVFGSFVIWLLLEKTVRAMNSFMNISCSFFITFFVTGFFITVIYPLLITGVRKLYNR